MRRTLRFILGEELIEIAACDPTLTVLDWLRLERRLTGSKEGCAEGDCGACTVVVGRLDRGRLRYEAINACIRFLPTLEGCHLLTVEHLKAADGGLHPVQQALVTHHGSQCGFCTPGIVMSLFALWLNEAAPDVARIEDALAGNLCRCTGYQPIIAAALALYRGGRPQERLAQAEAAIAARLAELADGETLVLGEAGRSFHAPVTQAALAELVMQHPDAILVAGATDVGLWVTKGMQIPPAILYLGRCEEMRSIVDTGDTLRFGAMANHGDVRAALAALSPQLDELMRRFGGEQVRNAGTIGGNIANGSPIGDLPPALIALGARLLLRSGTGLREIALEDFFLDYRKQDRRKGEFVSEIIVPKPPADALFHVSKISKRFDEDISALCAAFFLRIDAEGRILEARLAYGGMAGIPKRAAAAEAALRGRVWDEAAVDAAIARLPADFTPLSDMRASAGYRLTVAGNLLRRFLIETREPATATRVAGLLVEAAHG
ncbi:FAD-binding molybdopterin dehydrogenase [Bosea sp. Leaf344]|uniref:xanthine dehydrogenase small subunit n=1 Tax=Bosea sp. Leaf344 TaxID=1736346 RepID=UPI0006F6FFD8|nr:xanthine dehydrogenase small subunit [Bosea sp. Leaf344]KQU50313.1 FAD-binding molybdopterin dehydrogenase [Bosea sp. Leaf344]